MIDSGLARISRYSHRSKVLRLPVEAISQASANQRAGRCGRLGPGTCIRLFAEDDFALRPEFTEPEILRTSLASVMLRMASMDLGDIEDFPFVDPPPKRLVNDAWNTLVELNAMSDGRHITGLGRKLGYPTANLRIRSEPSPLGGVLSAFSRIDGGAWLPAVTNLGRRPAVGGREPLLEVHFFDFDEDLYGQRLEVQFVAKLRDELNFDSLDDLVTQMKQDELEARMQLAETPLPD